MKMPSPEIVVNAILVFFPFAKSNRIEKNLWCPGRVRVSERSLLFGIENLYLGGSSHGCQSEGEKDLRRTGQGSY